MCIDLPQVTCQGSIWLRRQQAHRLSPGGGRPAGQPTLPTNSNVVANPNHTIQQHKYMPGGAAAPSGGEGANKQGALQGATLKQQQWSSMSTDWGTETATACTSAAGWRNKIAGTSKGKSARGRPAAARHKGGVRHAPRALGLVCSRVAAGALCSAKHRPGEQH